MGDVNLSHFTFIHKFNPNKSRLHKGSKTVFYYIDTAIAKNTTRIYLKKIRIIGILVKQIEKKKTF